MKMAILMPFASIARCSASTSSLLIECPPLANEPLAFGYDYIPKRGVNVPLGAGAGEGSQGTGQEKLEVAPPDRTAKGGAKGRADLAIPRNPFNINGWWRRGWDSNPRYGYPYNGFRVL